jgi:Tol biopolymer transport system component
VQILAWSPDGKTVVMSISPAGGAIGGMDAIDSETGSNRQSQTL